MNQQEIFDKVARHLLTQGVQARDLTSGACQLRDGQGRKCALGCLISDTAYKAMLEMHSTPALLVAFHPVLAFDCGVTEQTIPLLEELQKTHDQGIPSSWPERLARVADSFGLNTAAITEIPS